MDLRFSHTVPAPLPAVEAALLSPTLVAALPGASSVLASAELRSFVEDSVGMRRETFFVLRGDAWSAHLGRVLPRIAWTERAVWSRRAHAGTFMVVPDVPRALQRRARCEGRYELLAEGPSATLRRIEGVLAIDAPLLGPRVEGVIGAILAVYFDEEARLLGARAEAA